MADARRSGPTIIKTPVNYVLTSGADPAELAAVIEELAERTNRPEWRRAAAAMRPTLHDARQCRNCGGDLVGRRRDAIFCGDACKQAAHRKREAGEDAVLAVIRGNRVEVSEDLVERGLLAFDKCEDKDAVQDAILRRVFGIIRIRNEP
ncbi:hypothetical protein FJ976_24035 [Mesorhizobium sp. B1-1-9]|uniref:hypothetical protein n=1 Tax=Mesorhizobium sp. B1-1-9 TaxID=2589975 RepID=UPI0011271CFC|nr:hypothetical protein [Mesorhizobium sp. B1-1-9]TPN45307.1 hypothetical protein FJ976_24035 [Mesorhizobium sp. B1-1-9]